MTISEIKDLCQEVIRLGEEATPGPWERTGIDEYHQAGYSYVKIRGSQIGRKWQIADVRFNHSNLEAREAESIASFIAAARTFTPQAAKALLSLINYVEDECPIDLPQEKLNEIRKLFD